jgi:hypothetical protein
MRDVNKPESKEERATAVSTTEQRAKLESHRVVHRMGKVRTATGFTNR